MLRNDDIIYDFELSITVRNRKTSLSSNSNVKTSMKKFVGVFLLGIVGLEPGLSRQALCLDDEALSFQQIN